MITLTLPSAPGVYRIVDAKTGRFYVGSSINVAKRWRQHCDRLARGTHPNPRLQAIWGVDPMRLQVELLELCAADAAMLLAAEQKALDAAGVGSDHCMNVLAIAGSHLGRKRSEATRAAMSLAARGKTHSDQAKALMRAAKLGKPLSTEHRRKLSIAGSGKKLPPRERLPRPDLRRYSEDQVLAIRAQKTAGASYTTIERTFGISRGALQRMLRRETYAEMQ